MFNFFTQSENRGNDYFYISGSDFNHIKNVLRMKKGETFLISVENKSHLCQVENFTESEVVATIIERDFMEKILAGALIVFGGGLGGTIYGVKLMKEAKAAEKSIKGVRKSRS